MIRVTFKDDEAMWRELADEVRADTIERATAVVEEASRRLLVEIRRRLTMRGPGDPSLPGESPAKQTGELARAFDVMPVKIGRNGSSVVGGVTTPSRTRPSDGEEWWPIIGALEYGSVVLRADTSGSNYAKRQRRTGMKTLGAFHIAPRPFIRPAEEVVSAAMDRMLAEAMSATYSRAVRAEGATP